MLDAWERLWFDVAELKRNQGRPRRGTVLDVWEQNGEQKLRVKIGSKPESGIGDGSSSSSGSSGSSDGSSGDEASAVTTAYLHTGYGRGPYSVEQKFRKGQIVEVYGDFHTGTVMPAAESQEHQRPSHANPNDNTLQYASLRRNTGPDYDYTWLAPKSQQQQKQQQTTPGTTAFPIVGSTSGSQSTDQTQMQEDQKEDVKKALVVFQIGKRPTQEPEQKKQAWEGPPKVAGDPQRRVLLWAKGGGSNAKEPPNVEADEIHIQYADKTQTTISDGEVKHKVGEGQNAATTTIWENIITHEIGGSKTRITKDWITHESSRIDVKGGHVTVDGSPVHLHGTHAKPMKMCGDTLTSPSSPSRLTGELHEHTHLAQEATADIFFTGSYSSDTVPTAENTGIPGVPFNGFRWTDTTSGIEYSYYNAVWSEGGGDIAFPADPEIDDLFDYQGRQWKWNGIGWESTLSSRMTASEGRLDALETVIDGGEF